MVPFSWNTCSLIIVSVQNQHDFTHMYSIPHAAMIKQFLTDVFWRNLDYLIIDTPPGTSDEHITVVEGLRNYKPDGAILVTTPQVCISMFDL